MEFRTKYDRKEVKSEHGSPIKNVYSAKYDKEHNIVIEKKATENLYSYINSFADSVDINILLSRFVAGDKEALLRRAGSYIDLSNIPTNLNEFIEFQRSTENLFKTLPVEIKEKFNNNVMEFLSKVGEKDWLEIMDTSQYDIKKELSNMSKEVAEINKNAVKIVENPAVDVLEPKPVEPIDIEKVGKK